MEFLSKKFNQFTYFDTQLEHPTWQGKEVLDFGGNIGNILKDPNSTIEEKHYWCMDIHEKAIAIGRATYPNGHWIFHNRYNYYFNPLGIPNLKIPDLAQKFDYILAYSVFTHTTIEDMLELVGQLRTFLKPTGQLAFTFIDPDYHSWPETYHGDNFLWRLEKIQPNHPKIDIDKSVIRVKNANWFTILNQGDLYVEDEPMKSYPPEIQENNFVFHKTAYIKALFPNATIMLPANKEMQHCCILSKSN